MGKYLKVYLICIIIGFAINVFPANEPTANITPYPEIVPHYSNIFYSVYDGWDQKFLGGFIDGNLFYSPTGNLTDGMYYDYIVLKEDGANEATLEAANDGPFFSKVKYDQLFMGTLIISENGWAESGGPQRNSIDQVKFTLNTYNQNVEFGANGLVNPTFTQLGFGRNWYLDRNFSPHYPIQGNMETLMKVATGGGIIITQRTAQFPSANWKDVFKNTAIEGLYDYVTPVSAYNYIENTVIKSYVITNDTDYEREIYITQRLDGAINTWWKDLKQSRSVGDGYNIHFFFTGNDGEFDDRAEWIDPLAPDIKGGFGVLYDQSYEGKFTGIGVQEIGLWRHTPISFRIIPYVPSPTYFGANPDNRLVKYAIYADSDSLNLNYMLLKPYNPMEYLDGGEYYNDFVSPGTFEKTVSQPGNYAIAYTVGPILLEPGQSEQILFAITANHGNTKKEFIEKIEEALDEAKIISDTGVDEGRRGFYAQNLKLPGRPRFRAFYEKYDAVNDRVNLNLKWDPVIFDPDNPDSIEDGSGYNLYLGTGIEYRFNRVAEFLIEKVAGVLKDAPLSYTPYTNTYYTFDSSRFKSTYRAAESRYTYSFALTANDGKWWNSDLGQERLKEKYFNESTPRIYTTHFMPGAIDLEMSFQKNDNSNVFKAQISSPLSREKDLKKYELYLKATPSDILRQTVYIQGGAYLHLKDSAEDVLFMLTKANDDEVYVPISAEDILFNVNDITSEVFIPNFSDDKPLIVNNFYVQNINDTENHIDYDEGTYELVWEGGIAEKIVYRHPATGLYYWEKYDDYDVKYYQISNGSTISSLPSGTVELSGIYATGSAETIIDYSIPMAGDVHYYYLIKKYDFLTPLNDIETNKTAEIGIFARPDYPKNLTIQDINQAVELSWDAASGDIYRYYVYRTTDPTILNWPAPLRHDSVVRVGAVTVTDPSETSYAFTDSLINLYEQYYYFVVAYNRTTNLESRASNIVNIKKDFDFNQDLKRAHPVPNPFIYGTADAMKENNHMVFVNLTQNADIKIYDIRGNLVRELEHRGSESEFNYGTGAEKWDLNNKSGKQVASGLYFYVITNTDDSSDVKKGHIGIVR